MNDASPPAAFHLAATLTATDALARVVFDQDDSTETVQNYLGFFGPTGAPGLARRNGTGWQIVALADQDQPAIQPSPEKD